MKFAKIDVEAPALRKSSDWAGACDQHPDAAFLELQRQGLA
jgi:hypothetical protein